MEAGGLTLFTRRIFLKVPICFEEFEDFLSSEILNFTRVHFAMFIELNEFHRSAQGSVSIFHQWIKKVTKIKNDRCEIKVVFFFFFF